MRCQEWCCFRVSGALWRVTQLSQRLFLALPGCDNAAMAAELFSVVQRSIRMRAHDSACKACKSQK